MSNACSSYCITDGDQPFLTFIRTRLTATVLPIAMRSACTQYVPSLPASTTDRWIRWLQQKVSVPRSGPVSHVPELPVTRIRDGPHKSPGADEEADHSRCPILWTLPTEFFMSIQLSIGKPSRASRRSVDRDTVGFCKSWTKRKQHGQERSASDSTERLHVEPPAGAGELLKLFGFGKRN